MYFDDDTVDPKELTKQGLQKLIEGSSENPFKDRPSPLLPEEDANLFNRVSKQYERQQELGNVQSSPSATQQVVKEVMSKKPNVQLNPLQAQTAAPSVPIEDAYGEDLSDSALKSAQEREGKMRMLGGLFGAGETIGAALSRGSYKPTYIAKEGLEKEGTRGIKNIEERRSAKDKELARKKALAEIEDEKKLSDPNSDISKFVLSEYKRLFPTSKLPNNMSAKQLKDMGINVGTLAGYDESNKTRRELAEQNRIAREEAKKDKLELKQKDKLDKDIEKHSKKLKDSGIVEAVNNLNTIDKLMGDIDSDKKDLPGYGLLGGLTPDFLQSKEGVQLRQAVQALVNVKLKDRSGAAVTEPEYERFKKEFGTGSWSTEQQLRNGLRQYRNILDSVTREIEASSSPEAISEYTSRPGSVSSSDIPGSKSLQKTRTGNVDMVKVMSKSGQVGMIPRDKLQEALARGAKEVK